MSTVEDLPDVLRLLREKGKRGMSPMRERWNEVYRRKGFELGIDAGNFIIALDEERVYALSPLVYYVWALCDGETSVGIIVENLIQNLFQEAQKVEEDEVYQTVITIIDRLTETDLVEKVR